MDIAINTIDKRPLSGLRVIDLTDEKGMYCSRLLAEMGADVIRIDSPDCIRELDCRNAGKRSIILDIKTPEGKTIFQKLVATADILVESFQPGYLLHIGIGYDALQKINHRLIMASITGFGQDGPYSRYHADDLAAAAMGGWSYVCGEADTPPLTPFGEQTYHTAGLFAANGILLALLQRNSTGEGQHIDISLQECAASVLDHIMVHYFHEHLIPARQGSLHWNNAFRCMRCKDGYVLLSLHQHWETLVEWINSEGMAGDLTNPRYLDHAYRDEHIDHIIEVLEQWTRAHTVAELVETGQLMRFPFAPVATIPELLNNPQLTDRKFFSEAVDSSGKHSRLPSTSWLVNGQRPPFTAQIPEPGQHTEEILSELNAPQ